MKPPNHVMATTDEEELLQDDNNDYGDVGTTNKIEAKRLQRNVVLLAVAVVFVYTAFAGLETLQTSLNARRDVGATCLASVYASMCLGTLFVAPLLIGLIRPKRTILVAFLTHCLFTAANYYPRFYTMIPACVLLGAGSGCLWTAQITYLTTLAVRYAELNGKSKEYGIQRFNGIYLGMFQVARISGNLISSLVLKFGATDASATTNHSVNATGFECKVVSNITVPNSTKILLLGVFEGCQIGGILLLVFGVASIRSLRFDLPPRPRVLSLTTSVLRLHVQDKRVLLLIPLAVFLGSEKAFMFGDYVKYFLTDCLGIESIGFLMMLYGAVNSLSAFLCGKIAVHVGRFYLLLIAFTMTFALIIFLLVWQPTPNVAILYSIPALWAISDAIASTQGNSTFGMLFTHRKEAAFGSYLFWRSIGFSVSFAYSGALSQRMPAKLGILVSWLVAAALGYATLEAIERQKKKKGNSRSN